MGSSFSAGGHLPNDSQNVSTEPGELQLQSVPSARTPCHTRRVPQVRFDPGRLALNRISPGSSPRPRMLGGLLDQAWEPLRDTFRAPHIRVIAFPGSALRGTVPERPDPPAPRPFRPYASHMRARCPTGSRAARPRCESAHRRPMHGLAPEASVDLPSRHRQRRSRETPPPNVRETTSRPVPQLADPGQRVSKDNGRFPSPPGDVLR